MSLQNNCPQQERQQTRQQTRQGTVTSVSISCIRIQLDVASHCSDCQQGKGCGSGLFSSLFSSQSRQIELPAIAGCATNDRVSLTVSNQLVLKVAFIAYCIPVLSMLLLASVCQYFISSHPAGVALGGITGLVGGLIAYPLLSGYVNNTPHGRVRATLIEPNDLT